MLSRVFKLHPAPSPAQYIDAITTYVTIVASYKAMFSEAHETLRWVFTGVVEATYGVRMFSG